MLEGIDLLIELRLSPAQYSMNLSARFHSQLESGEQLNFLILFKIEPSNVFMSSFFVINTILVCLLPKSLFELDLNIALYEVLG